MDESQSPYRTAAPSLPDPYSIVWSNLRRRRLVRRVLVGAFGYLVATAIALAARETALGRGWPPSDSDQAFEHSMFMLYVPLAVFTPAVLWLCLRGSRHFLPFMCPRCAEPFFRGLAEEIGFTKRCTNCGIGVGTKESDVRSEQGSRSEQE